MAKPQFLEARNATREYLRSFNIKDHMFHGPVSDQYWSEPFRVVAINMESFGYSGHIEVDRDTLIDWLYDAGGDGTRTTRYTLAMVAVLLDRVIQGTKASREMFRSAYSDDALLERTLERCAYCNIRPVSNTVKDQNYAAIAAVGESDIGILMWTEILALEPNVILVSGRAGLDALNGVAAIQPPIRFKERSPYLNGFLIQSIAHPSRPNYSRWTSMINDIGSWIELSNAADG